MIISQKSYSKETPLQTNANKHLGFAIFILRYQQLHRKLKQNPKQVLNLLSVKKFMNSVQAKRSTLEGVRFNYQDIRLNRYTAGKESLVSSCVGIVQAIIACFQSRYGSVESVDRGNQTDSIRAREGDTIIYHACKVLNLKAWYILDNEPQEVALSSIMENITFLHEHYQVMPSLEDITCDDVKNEYVCLVEYALRYFNFSEMDFLQLQSTLKQVALANRWSSTFLLV